MKIGIDIRAIGKNRTGDETYITQLVFYLVKIDKKNEYFLYTDTDDEKRLAKIRKILSIENNEKFQVIPIIPANKFLWTMFLLPKRAEKDQLDILHVQYITPLWLRKKTKLITTIHDVSFVEYGKMLRFSDRFFLRTLIPATFRVADKVIAVSDFTADEIRKHFSAGSEKIVTIHNGVVHREADAKNDEKAMIKYCLPEKFIFYTGTLQPRKNIPFLLDGFCKLNEKFADLEEISKLELVIGGNKQGNNYDQGIDRKMEEIKKENPKVYEKIHFIGYIDEKFLPNLVKLAEVFCYVSSYEGFGLQLLEAMTNGTPVLCNAGSSLGEVAGEAGLIYEKDDINDFAEKLKQLLTDAESRNDFVSKGRERAKRFSWEKNARKTLDLYRRIAA